jgi:hypothetical protein
VASEHTFDGCRPDAGAARGAVRRFRRARAGMSRRFPSPFGRATIRGRKLRGGAKRRVRVRASRESAIAVIPAQAGINSPFPRLRGKVPAGRTGDAFAKSQAIGRRFARICGERAGSRWFRHPGAGRNKFSLPPFAGEGARRADGGHAREVAGNWQTFRSPTRHVPVARPSLRSGPPSAFNSAVHAELVGGERATFCFGRKWPKTIAPGMPVSSTSCCRNCPVLLAPSGPARTTRHIPVARPSLTLRAACGVQTGSPCRFSRTSLCSDMRALLPLGAAMQFATSM